MASKHEPYAAYLDGDPCGDPRESGCRRPAEGWMMPPDRARAFRACKLCGETVLEEYDRHTEILGKWTWEAGEAFGGSNPGRRVLLGAGA